MQISLMKVFYGADSLPYKDVERTVHYPIVGNAFMGASNTTKIRFYVDRIGGSAFQWVVIGKLPNGKRIFTPIESSSQEDTELGENYIEFSLTSAFTQCKGDLMLSLGGYTGMQELEDGVILEMEGNPVIEKTGAIKVNIAYSTQIAGGDNEEIQTWLEFLSVLGTKANKDKVIITYQTFAAMNSDLENYDTTQYFFCEETKTIYKLDSGTMTVVTTFDRIGLISRSGAFSNSSGLSVPQLEQAKKKYCLMLYTGVSPREMYIKVSGVSSSETESVIKFVKLDPTIVVNESGTKWTYYYKTLVFNATNGNLSSASVNKSIETYTKDGADYYFANLFTEDNVFRYAPQTNETIDDDTSGTKLVNKNYVVGKVNAINTSIGNVNENVGKIIGVMPNGNIPVGETLATQSFVNSSIENYAARPLSYNANGDNFPTKADLNNATNFYYNGGLVNPTELDYVVVNRDESKPVINYDYIYYSSTNDYVDYYVSYNDVLTLVTNDNKNNLGIVPGTTVCYIDIAPTTRYTYTGEYPNGQWKFIAVVNNSPFTSAQWSAINSGATKQNISQIGTNQNDITDIKSKMPKMKDYVVNVWALVDGKYVAEISAGDNFIIDDDMQKVYTGTSASDNDIIGNYGIIITSDETTQKFTLTCYRGNTAPESAVNFTVSQFGGY